MVPLPHNEPARLAALRSLDVIGMPPEPHFDALCRTAAALFSLPIALVSLVEENDQWFKGKCGLDLDGTSREVSFCSHAILNPDVMVIEDATRDDRFVVNPLVTGKPHIRFYAGAPLVLAPGLHAGTLCTIDTRPRTFSTEQRRQLQDVAQVVVAQLRLHAAERALREREAGYRLLADNTTDMVVRSDLDGTRRYVSPAAKLLLGYEAETLIGTRPLDFVHPDDEDAYRRLLDDIGAARVTHAVGQQRYRRKDGTWVWVEASFSLTYDEVTCRPDGYVASVRDISVRKESEQRMAHLARHDALTGLGNRVLFRERFDEETARASRAEGGFAIHCLDLDRFKAVNDTLGHQAGDQLLRHVADRLRAVVRIEDIVARLGGDEFVVIQTGSGRREDAARLAERLIAALSLPIDLDGHPVGIGVSIGIALTQEDGFDREALYRAADRALYRAKAEGRNTFRFACSQGQADVAGDPASERLDRQVA